MTKSFTATCINQLKVEGKLRLEDTIQQIIPEARSRDPIVAQLATVAYLLGHRTGLQKADQYWLGSGGELMFDREQITAVFNQLRPVRSFRSTFKYNNIGYAMLGEIILRLTGKTYDKYLEQNVLTPLSMTRTITKKEDGLPQNTSLAYSALSDAMPYNVPLPGSSASGVMGSAGGLMTTANDLSKYYKALPRLWTRAAYLESGSTAEDGTVQIFPEVSWLFTPLQIMESPTTREKSYAGGWARSQLPGTVGDTSVNPRFVDQMPLLAQGSDSRLAFWHQGSLVGDTSFVMLLLETESAVVVLTNSMALNDAADWIGQLLVEILLDSPTRNDYVHLATVSTKRAIEKFNELSRTMEEDGTGANQPGNLRKYTGSYVGVGGLFLIDILLVEGSLEMRLQGRKSQAFRLRHQHDDVFSWFLPFDEQIKRGLFIEYKPEHYLIRFQSEDQTGFRSLNWAHDGDVEEGDDFRRICNQG
ncbi:hypothetical protein IFR05_010212 [Cadophora sp. M221]|nr:hypothetical protein IFR05_010212 [Cadophora sp. M221]